MILILSVWCKKCYIDAHVFLFLSYICTFLAQHCDVRYDFYIKLMYGWPLAPFAYRRAHVFLILSYIFTFLVQNCDVRYEFQIKTMYGWSLATVACRGAHVIVVLWYIFTFLAPYCPQRFLHKTDVRLALSPSCL